MTFAGAIKTCLTKYADFRGVASRSEYWYFILFTILLSVVLGTVDSLLFPSSMEATNALATALEAGSTVSSELFFASINEQFAATPISNFAGLLLMIPGLAVLVRRLHDSGLSAWYLILCAIPFVNIVLAVRKTRTFAQGNRFATSLIQDQTGTTA
jgi:uncharacterized membrane protein YhaH (DUF805 family)